MPSPRETGGREVDIKTVNGEENAVILELLGVQELNRLHQYLN